MADERTDREPHDVRVAKSARFERKFYLPSSKIFFAAHLLSHCCLRDEQYPKGIVNSVYYDTPELTNYHDSDEGNHSRRKVRIRWYDSPPRDSDTVAVFLELKSKKGLAGTKQRKKHLVPLQHLSSFSMRSGIISDNQIRQTLARFDFFPDKPLEPMIFISYHRLRFEDILTGTRVSLDWNVRSTSVSPRLSRGEGPLPMHGAVIEIKGQSIDIPATLKSIRVLETDWSRYSKYAACMESQLETPGSTGRFWPSGRVEKL